MFVAFWVPLNLTPLLYIIALVNKCITYPLFCRLAYVFFVNFSVFSFFHFKYVHVNLQYEANQAVQQYGHIQLISPEEINSLLLS